MFVCGLDHNLVSAYGRCPPTVEAQLYHEKGNSRTPGTPGTPWNPWNQGCTLVVPEYHR